MDFDELGKLHFGDGTAEPEPIKFEEKISKGLMEVQNISAGCPMLAVLIAEMWANPRAFVN